MILNRKVALALFCIILQYSDSIAQRVDSTQLKSISVHINAASQAGRFAEAASLMRQVIDMGVRDSTSYYGEAVLLGLAGDTLEGRVYLDTAIARGWRLNSDAGVVEGLLKIGPELSVDSILIEARKEALGMLASTGSNAEIHRMYEEGQIARMMTIRLDRSRWQQSLMRIMQVDAQDRNRIKALSMAGKLKTGDDFHEAGYIMHLGIDSSDFLAAMRFADSAISLGDTSARSLFAHAEDKYLMSLGRPQKYGTQFHMDEKTGKVKSYPIDPHTTDADRREMGLPTLKVLQKEAITFYGH